MKQTKIYLFVIISTLAFITCCKKTDSLDAELAKLPPITQTGANTFGCLVNGKAYIPSGYDGQFPNFDVIVDPSDSLIDIRTYSYSFNGGVQSRLGFASQIVREVGDFSILGKKNTTILGLNNIINCSTPDPDLIYNYGLLKITKYDLQNGIISGEFSCDVYYPNCTDSIKITNGRFDKQL